MRKTRPVPISASKFAIRIDSCDGGVLKGSVDNAYLNAPVEFEGLMRLIVIIDDILDQAANLQSLPDAPKESGYLATIELEIMFRQNHSWQGRMIVPSQGHEIPFKSVLELITILSSMFDE